MSPLEELEAAELTHAQQNHFLGLIASSLDTHGAIDGLVWSDSIRDAKAWTA